jgi:myo-inositol-1-phosphate synthase
MVSGGALTRGTRVARCEDSLLAAPIILDLILVTELFGRIQVSKEYNVGTCGSRGRLHRRSLSMLQRLLADVNGC